MTDHAKPILDPQSPPSCPVGERQCVVIDQLLTLQQDVALLAEQIRTDTLTELFNFRHFRLSIEQEMERTRRTGQPTALVMIDLDHFKQVNDNWGHEVGNQALVATAAVVRQLIRRLDIPCRYGGEEFAVILPTTNTMTAIQVAERVREKIQTSSLMVDKKPIPLTASLGVAVYQASDDFSPENFVQKADTCLYRAKRQGRNQVCYDDESTDRSDAAVSQEERDILSDFFGDSRGDEDYQDNE
ncbi:MAG: GGDEF domain-containing protein [Oceanicoccus sp.]